MSSSVPNPPDSASVDDVKPTGSLTYGVVHGANVWPGSGVSDKGLVRRKDHDVLILREFRDGMAVADSVSGASQVLTTAEWRDLPVFEG